MLALYFAVSSSMVAGVERLAQPGDTATDGAGEMRLLAQQTLPGLPEPRLDPDVVIARSGARRMAWLRAEIERADVLAVPSLLAVYERELALLEGSPRLRLRAVR